MTDIIISFETAKLAKEKGFDIITSSMYATTDQLQPYSEIKNTLYRDYCMAPTQSLLAKWLREIHNQYVNAVPIIYTGDIKATYFQATLNTYTIAYKKKFTTYEEALEVSLYETLILI